MSCFVCETYAVQLRPAVGALVVLWQHVVFCVRDVYTIVYTISQRNEISSQSFPVRSSRTASFLHIGVGNVERLPHIEHNDYKPTYTPAVTSSINIPFNSKLVSIAFNQHILMCCTM